MSVNKIKIRINDLDDKNFIKIPIDMEFSSVDQYDVVNRDFINVETEKSINPIVDYEKVRFSPLNNNGDVIEDLFINLEFLDDNGTMLSNTSYGNIGFNDDDIRFRKNKFLNSFLRLSFYDSDIMTNQNLVSFLTIYSKITKDVIRPLTNPDTGQPYTFGGGLPVSANDFPVKFKLSNPITKPEEFAEGFYLYHFKSDITLNSVEPKELYMRAEFNNAATGKITKFITTSDILPIDLLIDKLHTRYLLTRTSTGFYYTVDNTYMENTNITETDTGLTLNLYEIQVD